MDFMGKNRGAVGGGRGVKSAEVAERKKEKTQKGDCVGSTEHPGLLTPEGVMLESVKPHLYNEIKVDHDCGGGVE